MTIESDDEEDITPTYEPIEGPPTFVGRAEMQRDYWTHDSREQTRLEARGLDALSWPERLRLHHLYCLQRLHPGPERVSATYKCLQTLRRLMIDILPGLKAGDSC